MRSCASEFWQLAFMDETVKKRLETATHSRRHCPGTRWYGKTKQGKYMGECEALKAGCRAAYYRPCGTDCKK